MTFVALGLVGIFSAVISRILFDYTGAASRRWSKRLQYTRSVLLSATSIALGLSGAFPLLRHYLANDYSLPSADSRSSHMAITGLMLVAAGFITFIFTLLVHASILASRFVSSSPDIQS